MNTRGTLTFLAENSPPPVYRPSVGGAEARLDVNLDVDPRSRADDVAA